MEMTIKDAYIFIGDLMERAYGWHINDRVLGFGIGEFEGKCEDLIRLLKAQEPRLMTLWEAVGIIDRPVYLERNVLMSDKSVNRQECWALVQATDDEHMIRLATPYGEEKWHVGAYGIGWRCWTSRPTDEQREAIPWSSKK